ncbi:MAG: DUF1127 domain-containing protein [Pseudooceanicola sp.]
MNTLELRKIRVRWPGGNPVARLFERWSRTARIRRDIAHLSGQSDRMLRDIGLTRDQIRRVVRDGHDD